MKIPANFYLFLFDLYEKFGNSSYLKLILIIIGVFIMILLLAFVRKHIFDISMKGAVFGFFLGAILVILLDLILLAAISDKEKMRKLFVDENRQEAFSEVVVSGVTNLTRVLGTSTTVISPKKPKTAQKVMVNILSLPKEESQKVKDLLCPR